MKPPLRSRCHFAATVVLSLVGLAHPSLRLHAAEPDKASSDATAAAVKTWSTYKYGMFLHFGLATFTEGSENKPEIAALPPSAYAPTAIDADQWMRVARDAGMKYAVLTAKHSSGFCLWDSKVQMHGKEFDFDVANSGNKTDVVAAFVKACKKYGIAPGLYWCPLDFHNNSLPPKEQWHAGKLPDDFFQFAKDQFSELIAKYPDVGYYWIDIPRSASKEQRQAIYDLIKQKRPGTVVLFNHGTHGGNGPVTFDRWPDVWPTDIFNTERFPLQPGQFKPEQTWQGKTYTMGYEDCDCLGKYWFWRANDHPRPVDELLKVYNTVTSEGGNFLLDVPPDRSGRIPDEMVAQLMALKKAIDQQK